MNRFLIVDSREHAKERQRITNYFDKVGVNYAVTKAFFGDYLDYSRPNLVIDRKHSIAELAKNCTDNSKRGKDGKTDVERFKDEMDKAVKTGSHLVILVEQNRYKDRGQWVQVRSIRDLLLWESPHTMVRGEKVYRVLASWCAKYPLTVEFCDKRSTGRRIVEILYEEDNDA